MAKPSSSKPSGGKPSGRQVIAGTSSTGSPSNATRGGGPRIKGGTTTNKVRFG